MKIYFRISVFYCFCRSLWKTVKTFENFSQFMKAMFIGEIYSLLVLKRALIILGESNLAYKDLQGSERKEQNHPACPIICWQIQAAMTKLKQNLGAGHCSTNESQRSYRGGFLYVCLCASVCVCACMHVCMYVCVFGKGIDWTTVNCWLQTRADQPAEIPKLSVMTELYFSCSAYEAYA